jgi:ABC-2 type transport system ATP-binding protein
MLNYKPRKTSKPIHHTFQTMKQALPDPNLAISIKGLTKTYKNGTQALKGIDLEVESGDFFALLGANGAGKTTIIGILTSLVNKSQGSIQVYGYDLDTQLNKVKEQIGVVPQEFNFNIFEKVIDILVQQSGYFGIPRDIAIKRAEKILKQLELWDKRNVKSMTLSGGMKRRLMIARALIHQPKLLILDEPTAGVDVELRRGMWKYLRELNAAGTTILLTTHYLEEVEELCKNVAMIKGGAIIHQDSVKKALSSLEEETYEVEVCHADKDLKVEGYDITVIDKNSLEVTLKREEPMTHFILALKKNDVLVNDLRPKGSRMEQLFINMLHNKKT